MDFIRKRILWIAVVLVCLTASGARALDYEDVKGLLRNQVAQEVIVNMVNSEGTIYITTEQANELRSMGASENLIAAMRPRSTTMVGGATEYVQAEPVVVGPTTTVESVEIGVAAGPAEGSPVMPVAISMTGAFPPRYDKEGWLSISNHDWMPYYILINQGDKRIFISRAPNGGIMVNSGQNVVVNLRKETYKMYGDSGNKLEVKVRENETNRLSLNPFGVVGNSGLTGVSTERDKVRSEVLFNNYVPAPTVIIQEPAPVIVVPPPPPPVYYRPPYYGPRHRGGSGYYYRF